MPQTCWPRSSSAADLAAALAQQYFLLTGEHELASLVVHCGCERYDTGRTLRRQRRNFEHRVERVSRMDGFRNFDDCSVNAISASPMASAKLLAPAAVKQRI